MTFLNTETLRALIHSSARYLDDRSYTNFTDLFRDDGEYRIETIAPECPAPMIWMLLSREEMIDRFEAAPKHEWQITNIPEQSRLVAVDTIDVDESDAQTSSTFCLFHTEEDGQSHCYAVGRYEDYWIQSNNSWKLRRRTVNLKTRMLPIPSPLPI